MKYQPLHIAHRLRAHLPARGFACAVGCGLMLLAAVFGLRGPSFSASSSGATAASSDLEALLPELLEVVEESGQVKVIVHPRLDGDAELSLESATGASLNLQGEQRPGERFRLQRGGAKIERVFSTRANAGLSAPQRVALIFRDDKGDITMSVHRELQSGRTGIDAGLNTPATPEIVTTSDGTQAVTHRPIAPTPIVTERGR